MACYEIYLCVRGVEAGLNDFHERLGAAPRVVADLELRLFFLFLKLQPIHGADRGADVVAAQASEHRPHPLAIVGVGFVAPVRPSINARADVADEPIRGGQAYLLDPCLRQRQMAARHIGEPQILARFERADQFLDLAQPLRVALEGNQGAIQI